MSNPAMDGIHLTKEYYKDFLPTDLQWTVTDIDEDFNLYDLFKLVDRAQEMIPGISATMGMLEFKSFWEQIQIDRDIDDDDNVEYLELYWSPGYTTRTTKKTGKYTDQGQINLPIDQTQNYWDEPQIATMPNLMGFHGVGPGCPGLDLDYHECGDDCPQTTGYAVEFTPINNLAHLPIHVLRSVEFYPPYVECDKEFHRTGFELQIDPTLWCFITSIFWELTFVGSNPDEVATESDTLKDIANEANEQIKRMKEDEDNPFVD